MIGPPKSLSMARIIRNSLILISIAAVVYDVEERKSNHTKFGASQFF